jgi:hypothetical protein
MTGLKPTVKALCMLNILTQWAVPSIIAPRFEVLLVMKMSVGPSGLWCCGWLPLFQKNVSKTWLI